MKIKFFFPCLYPIIKYIFFLYKYSGNSAFMLSFIHFSGSLSLLYLSNNGFHSTLIKTILIQKFNLLFVYIIWKINQLVISFNNNKQNHIICKRFYYAQLRPIKLAPLLKGSFFHHVNKTLSKI